MLDVSAGRAVHDPVSAQIETSHHLMLGLRYTGTRPQWLYLSAGAPFTSMNSPWGAAGLGGRLSVERGSFAVGADLASHLFAYRDPEIGTSGAGVTLEFLPTLALRRAALEVEAYSGVVQHTVVIPEGTTTRWAHDSGTRVALPDVLPALTLRGEGRYLRTREGDFPYTGAMAELTWGVAAAWVLGGRWLSDQIPTPVYGVGATLQLSERFEVQAAWQQEASDPLYWNAPRSSWSLRVSHRLGPRREASGVVLPQTLEGRTIIRIPLAEAASAPYILGDFTDWQPVPMVRSGEYWEAALVIASGVYHYGFRTQEGQWFVPSSIPHQVNDGMGSASAVLIVP